MRILVVGGTRFMGLQAVHRLVEGGHEVTVFHRGNLCEALPLAVGHLHGDANELTKFSAQIRKLQPDIVLDMVLNKGSDTIELIRAISGNTAKLVAISSVNVYLAYSLIHRWESLVSRDIVYTEAGPLRNHRIPEDVNHDEKIDVERVVMEAEALNPTVLRLPSVHGPNDPQWRGYEFLWRMDAGRPHIVLNDVVASWRWSRGYVDNMVDAFFLAMFDERANEKTYNVADPTVVTQMQWAEKLAEAAGWDGRVIATSARPKPESTDHGHHLVIDSSLIRSELGYSESVDNDEWIKRTVDWLRANPPPEEDAERIRSAGLSFEEEDRIVESLG